MTVTVNPALGAKPGSAEYDAGNSSTAITVNWNQGEFQKVTMTGDATFTLSNPVAGKRYQLRLIEDATGHRSPTWPAAIKWPAGSAPTLSAATKIDVITLFYDGTNYYGSSSLNY